MTKFSLASLAALILVAAPAAAEDAKTVIAASAKAIGAENATSVTFHGSGATYSANAADARTAMAAFRRTVDFSQSASRTTSSTSMAPAITPADRQLDVWLTPWGFLKGAAANGATIRTKTVGGERTYVVSWTAPGTGAGGQARKFVGYIDAKTHYINGIETWIDSPAAEPTHVQALFGKWQDGGRGFKFPAVVVEQRNGTRTLEVQVAGAEANPANLQSLMAPTAQPAG